MEWGDEGRRVGGGGGGTEERKGIGPCLVTFRHHGVIWQSCRAIGEWKRKNALLSKNGGGCPFLAKITLLVKVSRVWDLGIFD